MLKWLKRFWSRDHQRDIFGYWDGTARRRADPLALARELERQCKDYTELLKVLRTPEADVPPGDALAETRTIKEAAASKLVEATRAAFGLKPLEEAGGLTEAETVGVLTSYLLFMEELARRAEAFR